MGGQISADHRVQGPDIVASQIETDIIFGHLPPGSRLVEDQLMNRYGASRHFVREALGTLEASGLIRRERNVGATVAAFGRHEVVAIYEVREMLTRQAILMIDLPASAEQIDRVTSLQAAYRQAIQSGDRRRIHDCNDAFHIGLLEACGNPWLVQTIKDYMRLTLPIRARNLGQPQGLAQSLKEHELMIELLASRDRWALAQLSIDHMQSAKGAYLERIGPPNPHHDK